MKIQGFARKVKSVEVMKEPSPSFNLSLSLCSLMWQSFFMHFIRLSKPKHRPGTFSESPENHAESKYSPLDFATVIHRLIGYLR